MCIVERLCDIMYEYPLLVLKPHRRRHCPFVINPAVKHSCVLSIIPRSPCPLHIYSSIIFATYHSFDAACSPGVRCYYFCIYCCLFVKSW